jgi:hypothetical protein
MLLLGKAHYFSFVCLYTRTAVHTIAVHSVALCHAFVSEHLSYQAGNQRFQQIW